MNSDPPLRRGTRKRKRTERYVHPDHADLFRKDMERDLPEEEIQSAIAEAFATRLCDNTSPEIEWSRKGERQSRAEEARDLKYMEDPEGRACVCNVRKESIRPAYKDLHEWMEDPDNVYISRRHAVLLRNEEGRSLACPGADSIWANPYDDAEGPLRLYRRYIRRKIREDPETYNLEVLRGKRLGCWCAPLPCHGDVLLELLHLAQT